MTSLDRFRGALLGLAVGDAVGVTLEFRSRGSFEPLTDLIGGGPFRLAPGQWSDDTSMALCLAASLVELGRFDARDQMERYGSWREHGYQSSTGRCFDIGHTVRAALNRYRETGEPFAGSTDPYTAGNGCLMRLAPVPMFFSADETSAKWHSAESARTTHGADECLIASRLFGGMICRALRGATKEEILLGDSDAGVGTSRLADMARGAYQERQESEVYGTGYVVDCLEAALWCFARTNDYPSAVLAAANLGDDADTTAAVCGQIAGAFYGASGIRSAWLSRLTGYNDIRAFADHLHQLATRQS